MRPAGETYWFSNFAQPEEPARGSLEAVNAADFRQRLLVVHHDDPTEVTRILQAIGGTIGVYAVYDIPSLPRWRRGAVCLIRDAAHAIGPHVGQGALLAVADKLLTFGYFIPTMVNLIYNETLSPRQGGGHRLVVG